MPLCCSLYKCVISVISLVFVFSVVFANHEYKQLCLVSCPTIITENHGVITDPYFVIFRIAAHKGRVWVCSPNINGGQYSTLIEVVSSNDGECIFSEYPPSFPLLPQQEGEPEECRRLYSVTVAKVDCCNRLWVLDPGILGFYTPHCPPKLIVFDLNTDKVLDVIKIPVSVLYTGYHLDDMEVQIIGHDCDNVYLYIADQSAFTIYTMKYTCAAIKNGDECWSVSNAREYFPDYHTALFEDCGNQLVFMIGIHAITSSGTGRDRCNSDSLYFHPLSSNQEYSISTRYLRDFNKTGTYDEALDKVTYIGERDAQSAGEVMTADGILFQTLVGDRKSIVCWNSKTPYRQKNLIEVITDKYFSVPIYVTIEGDGKCCKQQNRDDNLFISSTNFIDYVLHGFTHSCKKINAIISYAPINGLLRNGKCSTNRRN